MMQRAIHYGKCAGRKAYSAAPFVGIFVGGFIAGGLTVANPLPFFGSAPTSAKVAVKPVQSVAVDTWSRQAWHQLTEETARLRKELTEICRPRPAPAAKAPSKT